MAIKIEAATRLQATGWGDYNFLLTNKKTKEEREVFICTDSKAKAVAEMTESYPECTVKFLNVDLR